MRISAYPTEFCGPLEDVVVEGKDFQGVDDGVWGGVNNELAWNVLADPIPCKTPALAKACCWNNWCCWVAAAACLEAAACTKDGGRPIFVYCDSVWNKRTILIWFKLRKMFFTIP